MERHYEADRDLVDWVENRWGATPDQVSKYAYVNDEIGRRTSCVRTGNAFGAAGDHNDVWAYNDRNELRTTTRHDGTSIGSGSVTASLGRDYHYDPIGNRTDYTEGSAATKYYCTNELNQYETIDDDDPNCPSGSPDETLVYDADGNLTESDNASDIAPGGGRRVTYVWDAENRLIRVEPAFVTNGDKKVEYTYDYMGRRVEKKVYLRSAGSWTLATHIKFVWFNWLCILELDGLDSNAVLRKYTWGLDLAGQYGSVNSIDDAGGIGGLLSVLDANGAGADLKYVYCYDANGNVVQMLDPLAANVGAAMVAKYEYDAYGNVTSSTGPYAATNAWRFSTKQRDTETMLGYWGYRWCGRDRWLSRDPIGIFGGMNNYSFAQNVPNLRIDPNGLTSLDLNGPIRCDKCQKGDPGACPEHYVPPKRTRACLKPGWLWGMNQSPCQEYEYPPDTTAYHGISRQPFVAFSRLQLLSSVLHQVRGTCHDNCTSCAGEKEHTIATSFDEMINAVGDDWYHLGRFHVTWHVRCSMTSACGQCRGCCSITEEIWDNWQWTRPLVDGSYLYAFNWYLAPKYTVLPLTFKCREKNSETTP